METSLLLAQLTQRKWAIPIIGHLHDSQESQFSEMVRQLEISKDALSRTLTDLIAMGWVRNDDQMPAYMLSAPARKLGPPCHQIVHIANAQNMLDLSLMRWTLPILLSLKGWEPHFSQIRTMLLPISPRSLTLALKAMQQKGLVKRTIIGGFPPTASYSLTENGNKFIPALIKFKKMDREFPHLKKAS